MIYEANEVHLINELQQIITSWVVDFRFSTSKIGDDNKDVTPLVHKYYLPERVAPPRPEVIPSQLQPSKLVISDPPLPPPDVEPEYPSIIIRPASGKDDEDTASNIRFSEFEVDIIAVFSELDKNERFEFCLLAIKLIRQQLAKLPNGVIANQYQLQPTRPWQLYDNQQAPQAGISLTTTWRYMLPQPGVNLLDF